MVTKTSLDPKTVLAASETISSVADVVLSLTIEIKLKSTFDVGVTSTISDALNITIPVV